MIIKNYTIVDAEAIESTTNLYKNFTFIDTNFSIILKKDIKLIRFQTKEYKIFFNLYNFFLSASKLLICLRHYICALESKLTCNCLIVHEHILENISAQFLDFQVYVECIDQYCIKIKLNFENEISFHLQLYEYNDIISALRPFFITEVIKKNSPFIYIQDKRTRFLQLCELLSNLISASKSICKLILLYRIEV